jgi:hypothetical protein
MRDLNSNRVSQLVQISGIITSASKPKVRQLGQQQQAQSTGSCRVAAAQATCAYVPCAVGNQVSMSLGWACFGWWVAMVAPDTGYSTGR